MGGEGGNSPLSPKKMEPMGMIHDHTLYKVKLWMYLSYISLSIEILHYKAILHNRIHTHHKAKRYFDGACALVWYFTIVYAIYDWRNIWWYNIAISLKCKSSCLSIIFIGSYLQLENSKFGRNSIELF